MEGIFRNVIEMKTSGNDKEDRRGQSHIYLQFSGCPVLAHLQAAQSPLLFYFICIVLGILNLLSSHQNLGSTFSLKTEALETFTTVHFNNLSSLIDPNGCLSLHLPLACWPSSSLPVNHPTFSLSGPTL